MSSLRDVYSAPWYKNWLSIPSAILGFTAAHFLLPQLFEFIAPHRRACCSATPGPELSHALAVQAEQIRAQLPVQIDQTTTLTDVITMGSEIQYFGTVNFAVSTPELPQVTNAIWLKAANSLCDEEGTRTFIDLGGSYKWTFTDAAGQKIKLKLGRC